MLRPQIKFNCALKKILADKINVAELGMKQLIRYLHTRIRENQLECLKQSQTPATSINSRVLYQRESRDSNATLDFIQAFL